MESFFVFVPYFLFEIVIYISVPFSLLPHPSHFNPLYPTKKANIYVNLLLIMKTTKIAIFDGNNSKCGWEIVVTFPFLILQQFCTYSTSLILKAKSTVHKSTGGWPWTNACTSIYGPNLQTKSWLPPWNMYFVEYEVSGVAVAWNRS